MFDECEKAQCETGPVQSRQVSHLEKLQRQKSEMEAKLGCITEAISILQKYPDIERLLTLIGRY